jgi:hypothetical protein
MQVDVGIYTVDGRRIAILARGHFEEGRHNLSWDRRDAGGRTLPQGIYFLRLDAGGHRQTRKIAVLD